MTNNIAKYSMLAVGLFISLALSVNVLAERKRGEPMEQQEELQGDMSCALLGDTITNVLPMGFVTQQSVSEPKVIPVVVHIVYTDAIPGTYIDPEVIPQAIEQANLDFEGTGISFNLVSFDYKNLRDYDWHDSYVSGSICFPSYQTQATILARDIKLDLREYCNIYVIPKMCSTILGYAYVGFAANNLDDGVWVLSETFGVGDMPHLNPKYNENETLTHELGHYCGLFHTFAGYPTKCGEHDPDIPCEYEGDYVCDTAPIKASRGCIKKGIPGFNCPELMYDGAFFTVDNHMDYCSQECRNIFTQGQVNRMHAMLEYQRFELYSGPEVAKFCLGDVNKDGSIGTADLLVLLSNFGCVGCGSGQGDITLDYRITTADLNWLLSVWGTDCSAQIY
jgi:hypothetical protein